MDRIWKVVGWIVSVAALALGILTIITERKYPAYGNSLAFAAGLIVLGLAVNPLLLRSVKLFGRASVTLIVGLVIAIGLVCYASLPYAH